MNAPDRFDFGNVLGALSMSYAPLVDRARHAIGTRLTMLSVAPQDRPAVGRMLAPLRMLWSDTRTPTLVAPLDAEFDESLLEWDAPPNAILEIPAITLRDPDVQGLVQRARRKGIRLAMRGRPGVPLPPALLACFEFALIHITEDRRLREDGSNAPPPPGVTRKVPFIITGAFRRAELDLAYERGAIGSVGIPLDEHGPTVERPPRPSQAAVLALLRFAHERADVERMEALVRQDPSLMFELLRFAGGPEAAAPARDKPVARALAALGHAGLTRWLLRVLRLSCPEADAAPLIHTSTRRALFLEHLAGCGSSGPELRDAAYLTGAFSLLDRSTGTSFDGLLQHVALPAGVRDALTTRSGPCAGYLALAEAVERSDLINGAAHRESLGLSMFDCNVALLRALAAAPTMQVEPTFAGD